MIAVFKTGGKQYCVSPGQVLKVEKIEGKKGDTLTFNEILSVSDKSENNFGSPLIKDATIEAKILEQIRDKKVVVFKKRRRKNFRLTQGHRQYLTVLRIESIKQGNKILSAEVQSKKLEKSKDMPKKDIPKKISKKGEYNLKEDLKAKSVKKKKTAKKTIAKKTIKSKK